MSFILDALKKSETERQQQSSAEFAGVPTSSGNTRVPRWLWILGLLLAINLVVLLGLVFRPEARPTGLPTAVTETPAPAVDAPDFAEQLAAAKRNVPRHQAECSQASGRRCRRSRDFAFLAPGGRTGGHAGGRLLERAAKLHVIADDS
jgi:hypothetical protein